MSGLAGAAPVALQMYAAHYRGVQCRDRVVRLHSSIFQQRIRNRLAKGLWCCVQNIAGLPMSAEGNNLSYCRIPISEAIRLPCERCVLPGARVEVQDSGTLSGKDAFHRRSTAFPQ